MEENIDLDQQLTSEPLEGDNSASEAYAGVYPNAEVRVEKAQYSTTHLKKLVEKRHELIINPDFQRSDVWRPKQSAELVESILMGIPIPTIYLFEAKDGTKQVVDGRQRITAILQFLNDELTLRELKILKQYNGKKFSDLEPKMQGIFEDYQMSFYIIQPPTPERVKYDIFDRVNRGGTQLNSQEMRNALYLEKSTTLLDELAISKEFLNATGKGVSSRRKKDQYIILRSIAFYLLKKRFSQVSQENGEAIEYKSDIDDFLAKTMVYLNTKASDEILEECRRQFISSMSHCLRVMGHDAFRFHTQSDKQRRPINMPLFEVLMYIFTQDSITSTDSDVRSRIEAFKEKFDHQQMFTGNVDSALNVKARYDLADNLIKEIAND